MSIQAAMQDDVIFEDLKEKVDEFVKLTEFLAPYQERYEELKEELAKEANAVQDNQKLTLFGYKHKVEFSACPETSVLEVQDNELLFKLFGISVFKPDLKKIKEFESLHGSDPTFIKKRKRFLKPSQLTLGWKWGSRRLNKVK